MLDRNAILAVRPRYRDVHVAEWGGDVRLQEMTVSTRIALLEVARTNMAAVEAYEADLAKPVDDREGLAPVEKLDHALLTMIHAMVGEDGELLLTMDDYAHVRKLSFATVTKLWEAFAALNLAITEDAVEAEKKAQARPGKAVRVPARARVRPHG